MTHGQVIRQDVISKIMFEITKRKYMTDFDYSSYEKSLEKVLESAQRDYWAQYVDINRHQVAVARTYLWVSVALLGAYAAAYQHFQSQFAASAPCVMFIAIATFALGVGAFGICLYAIPSRKAYRLVPNQGWGEFSKSAYKLLEQN